MYDIKNNYKMNFSTKTLTITKEFERRALVPNSEECQMMLHCRTLCPELKIARRQSRANNRTTKGLTYEKMERYIRLFENANELIIEFSTIKAAARAYANPYNFVLRWFMMQFPCYNDMPVIHNGKLLTEQIISYDSFEGLQENKQLESAA